MTTTPPVNFNDLIREASPPTNRMPVLADVDDAHTSAVGEAGRREKALLAFKLLKAMGVNGLGDGPMAAVDMAETDLFHSYLSPVLNISRHDAVQAVKSYSRSLDAVLRQALPPLPSPSSEAWAETRQSPRSSRAIVDAGHGKADVGPDSRA